MNPTVNALYAEYLNHTNGDKAAAASLTLAAAFMKNDGRISPITTITAAEAATRLRISPKTIYAMCRCRTLHSYRIGRSIRIPVEEVERIESTRYIARSIPCILDANRRHF